MNTAEMIVPADLSAWRRTWQSVLSKSATCVGLGAGILLLDFLTSQFLLLSILYILPVGFAAWFARARTAYALALLLPIGSLLIVLFLEHTAPPHYVALNTLIEIVVLLFIAFTCGAVRQNFELKRQLRLLESVLPVCMGCKRIRDEHQQWQTMETYVTERTDSVVSHGVCPECAKRLYGNEARPTAGEAAGGKL